MAACSDVWAGSTLTVAEGAGVWVWAEATAARAPRTTREKRILAG